MKRLKKIIKKNRLLSRFAIFIINAFEEVSPFSSTHRNLMSAEEKHIRKKIQLDASVRNTHLDSSTFWLFWNISKNLLKNDCAQNKDWVIFDIGASNGWFSKIFSKFCAQNTKFLMFEPQELHKKELEKLSEENKHFTFFSLGLGAEKGEKKFFNNIGAKGLSSQFEINQSYAHFGDKKYKETVKTSIELTTLEDFLAKNDAFTNHNIMLKMDTQGAEFDILKGCGTSLERVGVIYMELQLIDKYDVDYDHLDVFNFLKENGFMLFDINLTCKEINGQPHTFGWEGHLTEAEFVFFNKNMFLNGNMVLDV